MSVVEWKDIAGYEGRYQVSNIGEVKSLARIRKGNRDNAFWLTKEKILSQSIHKCGYRHVTIFTNGQRKTILTHILVAQSFIPNPENKPQVNHKNGIKSDNRLENLEWATVSENGLHSYKIGTQKPRLGEKNELCKLSFAQVESIRQEYQRGGITQLELAKKHGVTDSRICNIVNYKARISA